MVDGLPENYHPFTAQPDAAPADAPVDQSLGDGFVQAPEPTVDDTAPGAPSPQEQPTTPQVSYEEFQRIQGELAAERNLLDQIRQTARAQEEQQREQQYYNDLRNKLQNELKRSLDSGDEAEITERLFGLVNGELNQVRERYQQQVNESHAEMRAAFLSATIPGFAKDLVQQYNLPPEMEQRLASFGDPEVMTQVAQQTSLTLQQFQQQQQQQVIQQQAQVRRDSGVNAIGGVNGGPLPEQDLPPGRASDPHMQAALRRAIGL